MVNFIVCDDKEKYRKLIKDVITAYMMKNEIEYRIHMFDDYNDKFMKAVDSKMSFKIYILDIEAPTRSGIDIARIIRNKDVDSVLIFITGHQELGQIVMKNEFLFLTFINKFDNCEIHLKKAISKALKVIKTRKTIKFKDGGTIYNINIDDILYILKDSGERRVIIKTDYCEFKINKTLSEVRDMLTDNFVQTHRACFINKNRFVSYNRPNKLITFDNNETLDIVSTKYEKVLM